MTPESIVSEPTLDTWENRRRMAYICLVALLVVIQEAIILSILLPAESMTAIMPVITTSLFVLASVISAYMGLATLNDADFWTKKKE